MKAQEYARIHAEMENSDQEFLHLSKKDKKAGLDVWLSEALEAAESDPDHFTVWEKVNFRDAISASCDGLFWLSHSALYKATMPAQPALNLSIGAAEDLSAITLETLIQAAAQLRQREAQPFPIFMRN